MHAGAAYTLPYILGSAYILQNRRACSVCCFVEISFRLHFTAAAALQVNPLTAAGRQLALARGRGRSILVRQPATLAATGGMAIQTANGTLVP